MSKRYIHYMEDVVRSHLPIYCRKRFHYFVLFLYVIVQYQICKLCAQWRHDIKLYKVIPVNASDYPANQTTSFYNLSLSNLTTSFDNDILANSSKSSALSNNTRIILEDMPPLYVHAFLPFLFHFGIHIFLFVFRAKHQLLFGMAICYLNWINVKDSESYRKCRDDYLQKIRRLRKCDETTLKKILTLKERGCLFKWWHTTCTYWNPTVQFFRLSYPTIDCTLADYMFCNLRFNGDYQIFGAIELIYEVMKGLDFLHYRNTYHLNLKPESVQLHCNGRQVYVKLANFKFMKKAVNKNISPEYVGLKGFHRPLECNLDEEVDAEKCDIWGLGMVSLDLFTGGMFHIKTEETDVSESDKLITNILKFDVFNGCIQETYGVVEMFQDARYTPSLVFDVLWEPIHSGNIFTLGFSCVSYYKYKTYDVDHLTFIGDIREFVHRLLIFSFRRRTTLAKAFKEPLFLKRRLPKIRDNP